MLQFALLLYYILELIYLLSLFIFVPQLMLLPLLSQLILLPLLSFCYYPHLADYFVDSIWVGGRCCCRCQQDVRQLVGIRSSSFKAVGSHSVLA